MGIWRKVAVVPKEDVSDGGHQSWCTVFSEEAQINALHNLFSALIAP